MKISVIMPSFLGFYKNAAKDREKKIIRAIDSVIQQTFQDWELIIVSDGCQKTNVIVAELREQLDPQIANKIHLYGINKSRIWSGRPRNVGLDKATGDLICYLDTDDFFGVNHLEKIVNSFTEGVGWVYFDNYSWKNGWHPEKVNINFRGYNGTGNIAHRRNSERWTAVSYYASDDWGFIRNLKKHHSKYIGQGEYYICHVPSKYDV
jgi:glycosyltransferase involved in cell wall biosynthesis